MIAGTGCSPDSAAMGVIATNVKECTEIGAAVCEPTNIFDHM